MEDVGIDAVGRFRGVGLVGDEKVYGSAHQLVGKALSHFQIFVLGKEGALDGDVCSFGVEGSDFEGELAAFEGGFGLAVAGHGLDHILFCYNQLYVFWDQASGAVLGIGQK